MRSDREEQKPRSPAGILRAFVERMRHRSGTRRRTGVEQWLHDPDEPLVLSEEGTREVLYEIVHGSPLTPERRATFERSRRMEEVHRRSEALAEEMARGR